MKKMFLLLTLGLSIAVLTGCAGKDGKDGAAGAAGPQGTAGLDNSANLTCKGCHASNQTIVAKEEQWATTLHATGHSWEYAGSRTSCRRCHNGIAYIAQVNGSTISAYDSMNITTANCRTCHKIHQSYDTTDWALTNVAPISLVSDSSIVDLGKGNLCGACHQSRDNPKKVVDSVAILPANVKMGTRWGGHHGPQTNVVGANGGWETMDAGAGKQTQNAHKLAANNSCVGCHVSTTNGHNHTFEPNAATCNTTACHGTNGITYSSANGYVVGTTDSFQVKYKRLLAQVRDTLVGRDALALGGITGGGIATTASWTAADTVGRPAAIKTAWVNSMSSTTNIYGVYSAANTVPRAVAGLAFNYWLNLEDLSFGAHNLKYQKYLLNVALTSLNPAIVSVYP